ncbi:MAG: (d)CMP kinase [Bacteroidales bacterium]|nr:(d)CMP kinase [Bacteroidales bacterium]
MNQQNKKGIVIAIDGHSSCGKSTLARKLAQSLSFLYVDTGAMYRAVTLFAIENDLIDENFLNTDDLILSLNKINVSFKKTANNRIETLLNGVNVEDKIRSLEVSNLVSKLSTILQVRSYLVDLQRKMAEQISVVMDGRDIGTVVFPNADLKIFLTASAQIRAERRFKELNDNGENVSFDEVFENVVTRDKIDSNRAESPLRQANDAILIDNTNMNQDETLQVAMKLICEVLDRKNLKNNACRD